MLWVRVAVRNKTKQTRPKDDTMDGSSKLAWVIIECKIELTLCFSVLKSNLCTRSINAKYMKNVNRSKRDEKMKHKLIVIFFKAV